MSTASQAAVERANTVLEAQVASLLQRLDRHRQQRCREVLEESAARAAEIEHAAWHEAAARGRAAVAEVRAHLAAGRSQTQATLDAALRQFAQSKARANLEHLWHQLPGTLEALWRDPQRRDRWLRGVLALAGETLVDDHWSIEHDPALDRTHVDEVMRSLGLLERIEATIEPRPDIRAGIRIRSDGVCIDATIAGLLTDAREIEASFLAMCDQSGPAAEMTAQSEPADD